MSPLMEHEEEEVEGEGEALTFNTTVLSVLQVNYAQGCPLEPYEKKFRFTETFTE
jgi:hypothetical protein